MRDKQLEKVNDTNTGEPVQHESCVPKIAMLCEFVLYTKRRISTKRGVKFQKLKNHAIIF